MKAVLSEGWVQEPWKVSLEGKHLGLDAKRRVDLFLIRRLQSNTKMFFSLLILYCSYLGVLPTNSLISSL